MINLPELTKSYVRVYIKGINTGTYQTLGPYSTDYAIQLMKNYLSTGICSWVEKIER